MTMRRIVLGSILFAMGLFDSISLLVDEWEGRRCWDLGSPEYIRLPFAAAFSGAWNDLLKNMTGHPAFIVLTVLMYTAFLWAVLAVLIAPRRLISITAFLAVALPFALTAYDKIMLGLDPYCDGHGEEALGAMGIKLLFVLPLGIILLSAAILARPSQITPQKAQRV